MRLRDPNTRQRKLPWVSFKIKLRRKKIRRNHCRSFRRHLQMSNKWIWCLHPRIAIVVATTIETTDHVRRCTPMSLKETWTCQIVKIIQESRVTELKEKWRRLLTSKLQLVFSVKKLTQMCSRLNSRHWLTKLSLLQEIRSFAPIAKPSLTFTVNLKNRRMTILIKPGFVNSATKWTQLTLRKKKSLKVRRLISFLRLLLKFRTKRQEEIRTSQLSFASISQDQCAYLKKLRASTSLKVIRLRSFRNLWSLVTVLTKECKVSVMLLM